MNNRIIYKNTEGGVSVFVPSPDVDLPLGEVAKAVVPSGVPYEVVDTADLPQDRLFRNAWTQDGKTVKEDMTKARNIAHEKRREKRDEEFAPLDRDVTIPDRAAEAEQARADIRAKDAIFQEDLDACSDVDQLRSVLLGGLNDR